MNNGLLPVVVTPDFLQEIFAEIEKNPEAKFEVNLQAQTFTIVSSNKSVDFEINAYKKHCLLNGLDDIDYLVNIKDEIEAFEKAR